MPTALFLGASSDMAVATARLMATKGYNIQLAARNSQRLQALQSDIQVRSQVACTVHEFDAAKLDSHNDFWNSLPEKPTVVICVFGYMSDNEQARVNWAESEKMITSNFTGAVSILNIVSKYYEEKKSGTIIGISSVAGERGRQSNYIYGSAKAGFTAYLSGLRNRMFPAGVHVGTILPGFVYTRMTESLKLPAVLTAQPEDVAKVIIRSIEKKKNVVYVKWFWRWIMLIIKLIPEFMFKKLKL